MLTFDYETEGIVGNPIYNPPRPVGVSIKIDDRPSHYWAWGHPTENNCSWDQGRNALLRAMKQHPEWLAHHAPFETAVSKKWFGITKRIPENFHDTKYLIFLSDPYAPSFSLKPSAERILGWAPEEQDELRDWILRNVPQATTKDWGAYICLAPGNLVGRYACGDTDRTYALFQSLHPRIVDQGMAEAYVREQKVMPVFFETSERGLRCDMEGLERDIKIYRAAQKISDDYVFSRLGEFDISKPTQLADALDRAGQVSEWILTPTGQRSTARKNLLQCVSDHALVEHLAYRGMLKTCLGTFAEPWLARASRESGRLHAEWNQVRGNRGADGDISGTRTGRPSCQEPNLANVPNDFEDLSIPPEIKKFFHGKKMPEVIHCRKYLLPDEGHTWLKRDFAAQEMRILAHFSEGKLYEAFHTDPDTDPHVAVAAIILAKSGITLSRKFTKITGFGIMYGRGIDNLSLALGVDTVKGNATRSAYYDALPEVRWLSNQTRACGKSNQPIRTWGGRLYYREPNEERDLSYKLLNYLIQGSAADQTKQCMIEWAAEKAPYEHYIAQVYDEMNIGALIGSEKKAMKRLREVMNADRFDVPFRSQGYMGPNWSDLEECE